VPQVSTLVLSVAAARYLGADGLGRQSFIAFVSLSMTTLLADGVSASLGRHVGEALGRDDESMVTYLARLAWRVQLGAAALGAAALAAIGALGETPRSAWFIAAAVCAASILHGVPHAVLAGMQQWRGVNIVGLVNAVLVVPVTISVLALGGGITGMFAVEAIFATIGLVATGWLARRAMGRLPLPVAPPPAAMRSLLAYAAYATASAAVTLVVWRRSELFFLERFASDKQVAFYSIAFAAVSALSVVPLAISIVTLPAFATLQGAKAHMRIGEGAARAVRLLMAAALPLTAAAIALAPEAIELVYGREFGPVGPVLQLMVVIFPLVSVWMLCWSLLYALGHVGIPLAVSAAAAVVNVGLDLLLIPGHGAMAAVVANLGGQLCAATPVVVYAWRMTGRRRWWSPAMAWMGLASAFGGAAVAAVGAGGGGVAFLLAGAAGLAAFVVVCVLAPVVESDDARWLEGALGGRFGATLRRLSAPAR
jgi:O-antigen/teichoic acid export membrane protein